MTAPGVDLGPIRRNLELKATDPDPRRSLATCRALGAVDHGVLSQRDTYFAAPHGRLKLREESPGSPQLIHYERSDEPRARPSHYRIAPVADPETLCAILAAALGIRGVVVKRRRLLLWHDVRIHLDEVDGCGAFLELEAVAAPESDFGLERRRIAALREALDLGDDRLLAGGYIDASGDADALDDAPRQPLY